MPYQHKTRKRKVCPFSSKVDKLYKEVTRSYTAPDFKIVRKICGKKAFEGAKAVFFPESDTKDAKKWSNSWSPKQIRTAKGFLYTRKLRKNTQYGFKLISVKENGEESVIGQKNGSSMFAMFK